MLITLFDVAVDVFLLVELLLRERLPKLVIVVALFLSASKQSVSNCELFTAQ